MVAGPGGEEGGMVVESDVSFTTSRNLEAIFMHNPSSLSQRTTVNANRNTFIFVQHEAV